jgi:hypothetical protein
VDSGIVLLLRLVLDFPIFDYEDDDDDEDEDKDGKFARPG